METFFNHIWKKMETFFEDKTKIKRGILSSYFVLFALYYAKSDKTLEGIPALVLCCLLLSACALLSYTVLTEKEDVYVFFLLALTVGVYSYYSTPGSYQMPVVNLGILQYYLWCSRVCLPAIYTLFGWEKKPWEERALVGHKLSLSFISLIMFFLLGYALELTYVGKSLIESEMRTNYLNYAVEIREILSEKLFGSGPAESVGGPAEEPIKEASDASKKHFQEIGATLRRMGAEELGATFSRLGAEDLGATPSRPGAEDIPRFSVLPPRPVHTPINNSSLFLTGSFTLGAGLAVSQSTKLSSLASTVTGGKKLLAVTSLSLVSAGAVAAASELLKTTVTSIFGADDS